MSAPSIKRVSKVARRGSPAIVDAPAPHAAESVTSPIVEIQHEDIARLAYSYWVARGYQGGSAEEDWLLAEHQLQLGN